jgi:hypothetical protein
MQIILSLFTHTIFGAAVSDSQSLAVIFDMTSFSKRYKVSLPGVGCAKSANLVSGNYLCLSVDCWPTGTLVVLQAAMAKQNDMIIILFFISFL